MLSVGAMIAVQRRVAGDVVFLLLILVIFISLMLTSYHPGITVMEWSVLAREVMPLGPGLDVVSATG